MYSILIRPCDIKHLLSLEILWLPTLSVPDDGYSRNASCALNVIYTGLFTCIVYVCVTGYTLIRNAFLALSV